MRTALGVSIATVALADGDGSPVPVENLRSKILMVQSTQNWHR
jgi:hypothetical protein